MIFKLLWVANPNFFNFLTFLLERFVKITTLLAKIWSRWITLDLLRQIIILFSFSFEGGGLLAIFINIVSDLLEFLFKLTDFVCWLIGGLVVHRIASILIRILIHIVVNNLIIFCELVLGLAANIIWMRNNQVGLASIVLSGPLKLRTSFLMLALARTIVV